MLKKAIAVWRAFVTLLLFAFFGLGGLLVSPVMLLIGDVEICSRFVRALWIPMVKVFSFAGLISVDVARLGTVRGSVIAATHPSLIDVMILLVLVPRTLFVAKHSLRKNPFVAFIVMNSSLPDDGRLVEAAKKHLERGWNVLVFPEGTRSPAGGGLWPFKRGAAQLAIRTGAPIVPLAVVQKPFRILGKHQYAWQMGSEKVRYILVSGDPVHASANNGESFHSASKRVTSELQEMLESMCSSV